MERMETLVTGRNWLAVFVAGVAALVLGSLIVPDLVYDSFIWKYFWGPVYADAHNAQCAVMTDSGIRLLASETACQTTAAGEVAYPGYTIVSEVGYMLLLVFMIAGIMLLLRYLEIEVDRNLFFALVPIMLFGGALRVVEDAFDTVPAGAESFVTYPLNTLIISPFIYGTVFVIAFLSLLLSVQFEQRDVVDSYHRPLAAITSAILVMTVLFLVYSSITLDYIDFYPQILLVDVVGATVIASVLYRALDWYDPEINAGTRRMGLIVIWAQAVDGVANVVAADWTTALGNPLEYGAKHPANRIIVDLTQTVLPKSITSVIGSSWPFLLVKLGVAVGIVWLFDDRIIDENPRYAVLLLIAAVAVGLGPGTRDVLRVTFGV